MHKAHLRRLSEEELQLKYRQICRNITRDSVGTCISAILAFALPWLVVSGAISVFKLVHDIMKLSKIKQVFREFGFHVKKREIAKGITEGFLTKMCSTIITLGHDELISATGTVALWVKRAGSYIAMHLSSPLATGWSFDAQRIIDWDQAHRMSHSTLQHTTSMASWATEKAQYMTHTGTEEQKSLGWKESGSDLTKQVVVVGTAQAVSGIVVDAVLEKPYDKGKDSSWYYRQRERVKGWFS